MKATEVTITDYLSSHPLCRVRIKHPSLEQVEDAVRSLDGDQRSTMTIYVTDERYMLIGGGGNHYICEVFPETTRLLNLGVPEDSDQYVTVVVGQPGEYWQGECVPLHTVLQAARHFADTGEMDGSLLWSEL